MHLAPNAPVTSTAHVNYSGGMRGVAQTINVLRRMVDDYKLDADLRNAAVGIIYLAPAKAEHYEVQALLDYVQQHIRYVRDINGVETIATPDHTMASRIGDCDDQSLLLATLLECVGYPTRFVVAGYSDPASVEHVYLQVYVDDDWLDCDPTEHFPLGQAPPDPVACYIEKVS